MLQAHRRRTLVMRIKGELTSEFQYEDSSPMLIPRWQYCQDVLIEHVRLLAGYEAIIVLVMFHFERVVSLYLDQEMWSA